MAEALECLGGNGYVEESGLPLRYREAPLNSVWEGSGNVNALDVLRALAREPRSLDAWITEVGHARGGDARLDRAVDDTLALLGDTGSLEVGARRLAGRMAACLQGALLVRFAPPEVADAFCGSRLGTSYDGTYGTLTSSVADLRRDRGARHAVVDVPDSGRWNRERRRPHAHLRRRAGRHGLARRAPSGSRSRPAGSTTTAGSPTARWRAGDGLVMIASTNPRLRGPDRSPAALRRRATRWLSSP